MKKIIAVFLSICMIFGVCAVTYAEDDKGLTKAITDVKSVIEIPAEYETFSYSSRESDGMLVWSLNWSCEGENRGRIGVTVDSSGTILSYNNYFWGESRGTWANMTNEEAKVMAQDFVKKVNPKLYETLVLAESSNYGSESSFAFCETANGIKLYNRITRVEVDRVLKKVTSYSTNDVTSKKIGSAEGAIDISAATEVYAEKLGAEIVYKKKYEHKDEKTTVSIYPAYVLKNTANVGINALTGEKIDFKRSESADEIWVYGSADDSTSSKNEAAEDKDAGMLTEQEIEAVEKVSGLIDKQQAETIIREAFFGKNAFELNMTGIDLTKNEITGEYFWNIRFNSAEKEKYAYASGTVNAKTGEIVSYYAYGDGEDKSGTAITKENALKTAQEFAEKYAKDRALKCKDFEVSEYGKDDSLTYSISADRYENGARVEDEGINISIGRNGIIKNYSMRMSDGLEFADISNAMTESEAVKAMTANENFEKLYVYDGSEYVLSYVFINSYINIDPTTGKIIGENENSYPMPEKYTDISGHWAEKIINTLLDNGYYVSSEKFSPDAPITIKEFLLFAKFAYDSENDEAIKECIAIVEPEKKALDLGIDTDSVITRETAAKYITYDMGCYDIASFGEIFKYPFADSDKVNESTVGHIAVCSAKKIFAGDENGNFNPSKEMTRAEAAAVIYNYYRNR